VNDVLYWSGPYDEHPAEEMALIEGAFRGDGPPVEVSLEDGKIKGALTFSEGGVQWNLYSMWDLLSDLARRLEVPYERAVGVALGLGRSAENGGETRSRWDGGTAVADFATAMAVMRETYDNAVRDDDEQWERFGLLLRASRL